MPYDANGNHSLPNGTIVSTGDKVLPSQHNPPFQDVSASLSMVLIRDGRAPMTGDLPMGGHKVTGLADGVADTDAATKGQISTAVAAAVSDLGIKGAAYLDVGTTAGTVAAGDDSRIVGAAPATRSIATEHSLAGGGDLSDDRTLSLAGDVAAPGNNKVYGTDGAGARGWQDAPTSLGIGQTWQAVSRAKGTVYQNTTGKPIMLAYSAVSSGTAASMVVSIGPTSAVATGDVQQAVPAVNGSVGTVSLVIPPDWYYRANSVVGIQCMELR